MLCLATQVSEEAAQLGPARFRELLDKAASSGAIFVVVGPTRVTPHRAPDAAIEQHG